MGKKGGVDEAGIARRKEQERQHDIRSGTAKIDQVFSKNFTPDFFNGRGQAYENYATPQLNDQYSDARKQLTYSLDRSGLLDSSARGEKTADLSKEYALQQQKIADDALSQVNKAKAGVESGRSDLITTLNATGDATGAANNAITRANVLSAPDNFSPIGQLFGAFTNALGTQAALERASAYSGGAIKPRFNTGLFGGTSSVKVS